MASSTSRADFCHNGDSLGGAYRWVGIVIEVKPGKFMSMQAQAWVAEVDITTDHEPLSDDVLSTYVTTSRMVTLRVEGALTTSGPVARPDWAAASAGEISSPPPVQS